MKYLIFCLVLVGLSSCSSVISYEDKGSIPSVPSDQIESTIKTASGLIPTQDGFTSSGLPMDIYTQIGEINLKKGEDGQYRELNFGYKVHHPENCIFEGVKGIYDWTDMTWTGNEHIIFEAGCFTPDIRNIVQNDLGYLEDENGTYYHDKEGGAYNLRRISKYFSGELIDSLVTTNGSGWIQDRVKLYSLGSGPYIVDQVFMNGKLLSGVTDPYALKIMNVGPEESPVNIVTDGNSAWQYKTQFIGIDADTFKLLPIGVYVDKNSCFIMDYMSDLAVKLSDCNPKTIQVNSDDIWKKMKNGTELKRVAYSDGQHFYDSEGNILENK